jgi:ketosteroid isomerase-like protein
MCWSVPTRLALADEQRAHLEAMQQAMRTDAIPLGQELIAQQTGLDRRFAGGSVTPKTLVEVTAEIGATQAALRAAHLKYHLETTTVLSPPQVRKYAVLRGYADDASGQRNTEGTSDLERVTAANQAFVAAISARDIRAMEALWAHDPSATFIGPLGTSIVVGWDGVKKAWEMRFDQFDRVTVSLAAIARSHQWQRRLGRRHRERSAAQKDRPLSFAAFVTNVFEKREGDWRVVSHQATLIFGEAR